MTDVLRFDGEICGFGTTSGHRFVIGRWVDSPFGEFTDVMHEARDGHRTLIAPSDEVAQFVSETYTFDQLDVQPVEAVRAPGRLQVVAAGLDLTVEVAGRSRLGRFLHALPGGLARSTAWCSLVDPVAHVVQPGVRTRGSAGGGRREWYGATDVHRVRRVRVVRGGVDLGSLAPVDPPVRFGFGSAPRSPSIVAVRTTIRLPT